MSRLVLIALAALMTLAAAPAGAAQSTDQANPCAAADALREAGDTKAARTDYVALVRSRPELGCAKDGLAMVNAPAEDKSAEAAQGLCARGKW